MLVWIFIGMIVVVIVIIVVVVALTEFRRPAQPHQKSIQKVDLGGGVGLEKMECQECGAELDKDSIIIKEGRTFISCHYCGSAYQLVEESQGGN